MQRAVMSAATHTCTHTRVTPRTNLLFPTGRHVCVHSLLAGAQTLLTLCGCGDPSPSHLEAQLQYAPSFLLSSFATPCNHSLDCCFCDPSSTEGLWSARHFVSYKLPWAVGSLKKNSFAHVDTIVKRWSPTWKYPAVRTAARPHQARSVAALQPRGGGCS